MHLGVFKRPAARIYTKSVKHLCGLFWNDWLQQDCGDSYRLCTEIDDLMKLGSMAFTFGGEIPRSGIGNVSIGLRLLVKSLRERIETYLDQELHNLL